MPSSSVRVDWASTPKESRDVRKAGLDRTESRVHPFRKGSVQPFQGSQDDHSVAGPENQVDLSSGNELRFRDHQESLDGAEPSCLHSVG